MDTTGLEAVVQGKKAQNSHTDLVFWLTARIAASRPSAVEGKTRGGDAGVR
jgi:hypothetical protein